MEIEKWIVGMELELAQDVSGAYFIAAVMNIRIIYRATETVWIHI
jgi:hypothetical protein